MAAPKGLPQALIEAQSQGLPIVATDVGGVAAPLGGGAGLLVPAGDAGALARAVTRIATDAGLRERRALAGPELARGRTLEATAQAAAGFLAGRAASARGSVPVCFPGSV